LPRHETDMGEEKRVRKRGEPILIWFLPGGPKRRGKSSRRARKKGKGKKKVSVRTSSPCKMKISSRGGSERNALPPGGKGEEREPMAPLVLPTVGKCW